MRKNLKNYTSQTTVNQSITKIQQYLVKAKAQRIMYEYDTYGNPEAIIFEVMTPNGIVPIKLPSRVDNVAKVMYKNSINKLTEKELNQVQRTAWANIRDWVDAQIALLETEMVKVEEVFLPYRVHESGKTYFEIIEDRGLALPE